MRTNWLHTYIHAGSHNPTWKARQKYLGVVYSTCAETSVSASNEQGGQSSTGSSGRLNTPVSADNDRYAKKERMICCVRRWCIHGLFGVELQSSRLVNFTLTTRLDESSTPSSPWMYLDCTLRTKQAFLDTSLHNCHHNSTIGCVGKQGAGS
jgi:hypothetical protein